MKEDITLVIMAAGIGSRFKGGVKSLAKVGPNNETIMELTIKDAKEIGFNKIVFIIRKELQSDFEKFIIPKIDMEYSFVYQELSNVPFQVETKREKPWGTGHALLCLKDTVKEDFVIINADDYYGKECLQRLLNHLKEKNDYHAMVAFRLKNTFGTSNIGNRGICYVKNNKLIGIEETYHIEKINNGFQVNNKKIDSNSYVSVNAWGFRKSIFDYFENKFVAFLKNSSCLDDQEFLIPKVVNDLLQEGLTLSVYYSEEKCLGITYQEDIALFKKEYKN